MPTYPRGRLLDILGLYNLITLNIIDFGHFPNPLKDSVRELSCVALDVAIEYVTDPAIIIQVGILCMCRLEEVVMVIQSRQRQVLLQHDDIGVVDKSVRSFMLCRVKGGNV
jgi:hypothetical protein